MSKILVVGEGAWGSAIANLIAHNGHEVTLWCHYAQVADEIQESRKNSWYMPGVQFSERIMATASLKQALAGADIIFVAIPVQYLRVVLVSACESYRKGQIWVSLSKGIERDTLLFPTELMQEICDPDINVGVFSGPTFAREVSAHMPTVGVVASADRHVIQTVRSICQNSWFRFHDTHDVMGVQICGALKNVIALGVGILEGAGYGQNSKAAFLTRGLEDMATMSRVYAGSLETVYGLAGVGDLILTAYGNLSKNFSIGKSIGAGASLEQLLSNTRMVPEGINTVHAVHQWQTQKGVTLPVCALVYDVLNGKMSGAQMITAFLHF